MTKDYIITLDGVNVILKIDVSVEINTVYYKNGLQPYALIAIRGYESGKRNAILYATINLWYVK
jgi:hypothetical protein